LAKHTAPDDIELLIQGRLFDGRTAEVHDHILTCQQCQERVMDEQEARYHIENAFEQEAYPVASGGVTLMGSAESPRTRN
jgi:hypothetical protein